MWWLHLALYLAIYARAVAECAAAASRGIVHFDLKADNLLLRPHPGSSESHFWDPDATSPLPFDVVLADFGEARRFADVHAEDARTVRSRGTECIKPPEMLTIAHAARADRATFDRRRRAGAGAGCDVWAAGCLLYELACGAYLFHDADWTRFFVRLTSPGEALFPPDKAREIAGLPPVFKVTLARASVSSVCVAAPAISFLFPSAADLIHPRWRGAFFPPGPREELLAYALVRDPMRRPEMGDLAARAAAAAAAFSASLAPPPPPA